MKTTEGGSIPKLFEKIESLLSEELVGKTQAIYQFNVEGSEKGVWFLDLKSGSGKCGKGTPQTSPDAILTMTSDNFNDMFAGLLQTLYQLKKLFFNFFFVYFLGKLKAPTAFMSGKLKINGDLQKAMKLSKLMGGLKSKL